MKCLFILITIFCAANLPAQDPLYYDLTHPKKTFAYDEVKEGGLVFTPEVGVLVGVGQHTQAENFFDAKVTVARQIGKQTYVGGGFGLDVLMNTYNPLLSENGYGSPTHTFTVPVFASVRYAFSKKRCSPYIGQSVGYSFLMMQPRLALTDFVGGVMLETQFGAKIFCTPKVACNIAVGYRFQQFFLPSSNVYSYYGGNGQNYEWSTYQQGFWPVAASVFYHFVTFHYGVTF